MCAVRFGTLLHYSLVMKRVQIYTRLIHDFVADRISKFYFSSTRCRGDINCLRCSLHLSETCETTARAPESFASGWRQPLSGLQWGDYCIVSYSRPQVIHIGPTQQMHLYTIQCCSGCCQIYKKCVVCIRCKSDYNLEAHTRLDM